MVNQKEVRGRLSGAPKSAKVDLLNQPKNTSASANRSGDTNLRMAVALVNGTRSIVVPCKATIWPEWP